MDEEEISRGGKALLLVCALVGAVLSLATFAVLSGGSIIGYVAATVGGVALGLMVAVAIHNLFAWIRILIDRDQHRKRAASCHLRDT